MTHLTPEQLDWWQRMNATTQVKADPKKAAKAVFRPATAAEIQGIAALRKVSFGMNAFCNSFRKDLRATEITDKQAASLWRMLKTYRRQCPDIQPLVESELLKHGS